MCVCMNVLMYVILSRLRSKAQSVLLNLCTTLVVGQNIHTIPIGIQHQQQQNKPSATLERNNYYYGGRDIR